MSNLEAEPSRSKLALCTTPWNVNAAALKRMRTFADWFDMPCVDRRDRSIANIFADEDVAVLVIANEDPVLYHRMDPETGLFFHLGMAHQRLESMRQGQVDRLIRVAGIHPGDHVLDATLGLGNDSMVFSAAVGPTGRVTSIESSVFLARLFLYGIRHSKACPDAFKSVFLNIDVAVGNHRNILKSMESDSVDVVYFDPMFRKPTNRTSSMDFGRAWANHQPLDIESWTDAQRVARKAVVLKERPMSKQFERFGLVPDKSRTPFAYGVWRKETSI